MFCTERPLVIDGGLRHHALQLVHRALITVLTTKCRHLGQEVILIVCLAQLGIVIVIAVIGTEYAKFQTPDHRYIVLQFELRLKLNILVTLVTGDRLGHQCVGVGEIRRDAGHVVRTRHHGRYGPVGDENRFEEPEIGDLRTIIVIYLSCEGGDGLEVFTQVHRQVGSEIVLAIFLNVADENTIISEHTHTRIVGNFIIASGHREVMLLLCSEIAQGITYPVVILIQRIIAGRPLVKFGLRIQRCKLGVSLRLIADLPVRKCIHHFRHAGRLFETIRSGVRKTSLTTLSFFGRYDDDAVVGIHPVDRGGRILQDRNGLDIFRVEAFKIRHIIPRYAIDDKQWRAESTNAHQGVELSGFCRLLTDVHAGYLSLNITHDAGTFGRIDLGSLDGGHRTGQCLFLLGTISHDHHFRHASGRSLHHYGHIQIPGHRHLAGLITHGR